MDDSIQTLYWSDRSSFDEFSTEPTFRVSWGNAGVARTPLNWQNNDCNTKAFEGKHQNQIFHLEMQAVCWEGKEIFEPQKRIDQSIHESYWNCHSWVILKLIWTPFWQTLKKSNKKYLSILLYHMIQSSTRCSSPSWIFHFHGYSLAIPKKAKTSSLSSSSFHDFPSHIVVFGNSGTPTNLTGSSNLLTSVPWCPISLGNLS